MCVAFILCKLVFYFDCLSFSNHRTVYISIFCLYLFLFFTPAHLPFTDFVTDRDCHEHYKNGGCKYCVVNVIISTRLSLNTLVILKCYYLFYIKNSTNNFFFSILSQLIYLVYLIETNISFE